MIILRYAKARSLGKIIFIKYLMKNYFPRYQSFRASMLFFAYSFYQVFLSRKSFCPLRGQKQRRLLFRLAW